MLIDEGTLEPPVRVQLVLGVPGAAGNSLDDLVSLRATAIRLLGEDMSSLAVAATGFPMEFRHAAAAFGFGMHCRVGMEDNLRVRRDKPVERNAELVEVTAKLADLLARPLATPAQLRGPHSVRGAQTCPRRRNEPIAGILMAALHPSDAWSRRGVGLNAWSRVDLESPPLVLAAGGGLNK